MNFHFSEYYGSDEKCMEKMFPFVVKFGKWKQNSQIILQRKVVPFYFFKIFLCTKST